MRKFFSLVTTRVKGLHVRRDSHPCTALRAVDEGITKVTHLGSKCPGAVEPVWVGLGSPPVNLFFPCRLWG